jgi:hypothetical protein
LRVETRSNRFYWSRGHELSFSQLLVRFTNHRCLHCGNSRGATTIDPLLFEELVLTADFAGVVECEQAGGIIAHYKIIESWKGPKAGEKISIREAVNYWEPQFPIALCGKRYFVTAYKQPPFRMISTTSGGGVPLWWRQIPSDYRLPLFQGGQFLKPGEDAGPKFGETRKSAQALLALTPVEQEAALLKAVIDDSLFGDRWIGGEPDEAKAKEIRARFAKLRTADALVGEMKNLGRAKNRLRRSNDIHNLGESVRTHALLAGLI